MEKYSRILVAVDGSKQAERAFKQAVKLASAFKSTLGIVGVVDERKFSPSISFEGSVEEQEQRILQKKIIELAKQARSKGIAEINYYVESGNPKTIIAFDIMKEFHPDLIIMGATGVNRISKILIGSVSAYILRQAKCDTLLVR